MPSEFNPASESPPSVPAQATPPAADPVVQHFDAFAPRYDEERFATSYGRYVDGQERPVLRRWLKPFQPGRVLDLACGTGRFLEFATHGLDASAAMVQVARRKHPGKVIHLARAEEVSRIGVTFDAIFCLHVFMHLDPELMARIIAACRSSLRIGGTLIFDVPSARRRSLTGFRAENWHAGNAPRLDDVRAMLAAHWQVRGCRGILFLPVHRLPSAARPLLRPLDSWLCASPLKTLASYLLFRVERRA